jgi:YidC/Oxa1 family membrane protein insertase
MEKRVLIAFLLSTAILAAWYYFFAPTPPAPRPAPPARQQQGQPSSPPSPGTSAASGLAESVTASVEVPPREVQIETPLWRATFTNRGAAATSWSITRLPNGHRVLGDDRQPLELIPQAPTVVDKLGRPFTLIASDETLTRLLQHSTYALSTEASTVRIGENETAQISFTYRNEAAQLEVIKTFSFQGNRYDFEMALQATHRGQPLELELVVGPSFGDQSIKKIDSYTKTPPLAVAYQNDKAERIRPEKLPQHPLTGSIRWVGVEDNYFALVAVPAHPLAQVKITGSTLKEMVEDEELERHFIAARVAFPHGERYRFFAGPKDLRVLRSLDQQLGGVGLESVINYGAFASLVKPLLQWVLVPALHATHRFTRNYGVDIILITLVINMFFFPLRRTSTVKMRKASAMQPRLRELQEKMKGLKKTDPKFQELQMEQFKLMREANPFGGCLPLLLQLPIFWAFFILLTVSIELRQAHFFGWIDDLSSPDRWHVLPIAMCLSMIASSLVMPQPAADQQQKVQRFMMAYLMPILLTYFFFWRAPSGLVLYWMFSNIVTIGQQYLINRLLGSPAVAVPDEGKVPKPAVSS